jgi:streptomycin 6-kinase
MSWLEIAGIGRLVPPAARRPPSWQRAARCGPQLGRLDSKGVVGELAYEAGSALRNPYQQPALFAAPDTIRRRVDCFAQLQPDATRISGWAFAQAVLSAIWEWEDVGVLSPGSGSIALATAIHAMSELQRHA